jgi:hypothetical protein
MVEMVAKDSFFTSENGLVRDGQRFEAPEIRARELAPATPDNPNGRGLAEPVGGGDGKVNSGEALPLRMGVGSFVVGSVDQPKVIGADLVFPAGLNTDEGVGMVAVPPTPSALGALAEREAAEEAVRAERQRVEANRSRLRAEREQPQGGSAQEGGKASPRPAPESSRTPAAPRKAE